MLGAMSVSSRSKAAIICGSEDFAVFRDISSPSAYLPTIRLLFTILHDSLSGSFCEAGLKKFATALFVVVDSIFRLIGGGERGGPGRLAGIARGQEALKGWFPMLPSLRLHVINSQSKKG